jgi:hypothetical protein
MTRAHWWIVGALALALGLGIAVASVVTYVPDEPEPTLAPIDPPRSDEGGTTVSIGGELTELSDGGSDGFFLLHVTGKGYLPVHVPRELGRVGPGQAIMVAVPSDFDAPDDRDGLYDALRALADRSEGPLEVVGFD